ncbi:MAG: condensation domain-containing protein, partial [Candidatus Angelobacter sp.]
MLSPLKRELLARLLAEAGARTLTVRIPARPTNGFLPVSFAQERLWFLNEFDRSSPAYNSLYAVRLKGDVSFGLLQQSIELIVHRHQSLRANFHVVEGVPVQHIRSENSLEFPFLDLSGLPPAEAEKECQRQMARQSRRVFDLENDLLLRLFLIKLREQEFIFNVVIHHIICD